MSIKNEDVTQAADVDAGKISTFNDKKITSTDDFYHRLLELKEDSKSIYQQEFEEYCKDKIKDLGIVTLIEDEEEHEYNVVMHTPELKGFKDLRVIADEDTDSLICIDKDNNVVIGTMNIDYTEYAAEMCFDKIDKNFYEEIIEYWDDLNMDAYVETYKED